MNSKKNQNSMDVDDFDEEEEETNKKNKKTNSKKDDNDDAFDENDNDNEWGDDNDNGWGDDNDDDNDNKNPDENWDDALPDTDIVTNQNVKIEDIETIPNASQQVKALTSADLEKATEKRILQLKDELNIEENKCLLLLRKYKWNMTKVLEDYFGNPQGILKDSGACINPQNPPQNKKSMECQMCYEDYKLDNFFAMECGHSSVCKPCWTTYLCNGVITKECITQTCPAYKCTIVIPPTVWKLFLENSHKNEYGRYLRFCREDFIEHAKEYAFCPGKNCDSIYYCQAGGAREVECTKCKYKFCWHCKLESHFPASCYIAQRWIAKNSNESENLQWILAKTKKCPKCGVHIEKNQGCNHMTCRKEVGGCGYEFCWLCKGDWKEHGSATGGFYQCNVYEKQKNEGKVSDEEKASEDASNELQRYEFHWTRYDSHTKSCAHASKQRQSTQTKMQELAQTFGWRLNESQFLLDATNEAIQCWHVLAWTYPIAYYFDRSQNIELFKQHQSFLEKFCDGLQEKLDFDIQKLGDIKVRQEMIHFTRTAQNYRKNLVDYIEGEIAI